MGSNRAAAQFGLLALGVTAVALAAWIAGLTRSPGWSGPVFALAVAGLVAAVMALTRSWRDQPTWVAALGFALIAVGSGIGRPRNEFKTATTPPSTPPEWAEGDVIGRLDIWWGLLAVGLLLSAGAVLWVVRARGARSSGMLAPSSLLAVAIGYTFVAVAMRELVVARWMSGRPSRDGRRPSSRARDAVDHVHAGDLWRDATADEAEAIGAFAELAEQLAGVGAPAPLVSRCHEAAREEQRHATSCMRLAARLGSRPHADRSAPHLRWTPVASARDRRTRRSRTHDVLRLATESFIDGVVGEGFAARRLEEGSATVADGHGPRLRSMALEERRHAALGADIVEWALEQHPGLVRGALRRAAKRLPDHIEAPAAHLGFTSAELRGAGLVDTHTADELWRQERTAALRWLDDTLASQVSATTIDTEAIPA